MDKSYALIKDGKVFNVISATPEVIHEIGLEKLNADAVVDLTGTSFGIGCVYAGGVFSRPEKPPEEPKPQTLEDRLAELETQLAELLK